MFDQRVGIKAEKLRIDRNHLHGFQARRHMGHIAIFNGFDVIGVNASGFARFFQAYLALFTFAL